MPTLRSLGLMAFALFGGLTACSDYNFSSAKGGANGDDGAGNGLGPCLTVSPSPLDFGGVLVGGVAEELLTITNLCPQGQAAKTQELVLDGITLADENAVFTLTTLSTTELAGGEEVDLAVGFEPSALEIFDGTITFQSNDGANEFLDVPVLGEGVEVEGGGDTEVIPGEPVSDAGPDDEVAPLVQVLLDGRDSYDPDGNEPLTYRWTFASMPSGSSTTLNNPNSPEPRFFADVAGTYEVSLVVTNSLGVADSTPDLVTINAVPATSFYVQLTWDTAYDLDLHLLDGGGAIFDQPSDACFCNPTPSWGAAGPADDASLDIDAIYGYGPETTTIEAPADGNYEIRVHYYGQDGLDFCWGVCEPSEATVDLYVDGVLTKSWTQTLNDQGDVWNVASLSWPSESITDIDSMTSTSRIDCY